MCRLKMCFKIENIKKKLMKCHFLFDTPLIQCVWCWKSINPKMPWPLIYKRRLCFNYMTQMSKMPFNRQKT